MPSAPMPYGCSTTSTVLLSSPHRAIRLPLQQLERNVARPGVRPHTGVMQALRLRLIAAQTAEQPNANAMTRAEVAWLDGLFAVARRDRQGLVAARDSLRLIDTVSTELLDRTLGAFEAELSGERGLAARTLANTNWRNPDLLVPGYGAHPYVIAVSRLAAARWLAAEGALTEADRLLRWFEASWALDGYRPARRVLGALATLERARIAARQDRGTAARDAYATFLRRYDAPVDSHAGLVDEAGRVVARP